MTKSGMVTGSDIETSRVKDFPYHKCEVSPVGNG